MHYHNYMEPSETVSLASPRAGDGELRVAISNAIVQVHREYFGKVPTKARTYLMDDLIVTVMHGAATRLEQTLAEAGEKDRVREVRQAFQDSLDVVFVAKVEQLTGRRVAAFLSQSSVDPDVSVEVFILEPDESARE